MANAQNRQIPHETVLCHCLGVTAGEIRAAAARCSGEAQLVEVVRETTAAGTGCTACHRRILCLLAEASRPAEAVA